MTTLIDEAQQLKRKFSFKAMREFMAYSATQNCETQAFAADAGTKIDLQTTGGKLMMINGQPIVNIADAVMTIAGDTTEVTKTAWATATSYSVGNVRWDGEDETRFLCIKAHTSSADNRPILSDNWTEYWEKAPHEATNATATSLAAGYDQWFMGTVNKAGTIQIWKAGDAALVDTSVCKVPQYDPKTYCVVGFLSLQNKTASAIVLGVASLLSSASIVATFTNVTGPVYPHPDNWVSN